MKKILFFFRGIYNGGTEIATLNLLKKICNKYDLWFTFYDIENSDKTTINKISKFAKYIPFNSNATFDTVIFCTQAVKEINELQKNFKYTKSYFWYHYYSENQNIFLELALNGLCDNVIAVSNTSKNKLSEFDFAIEKKDKIIVINNIIDIDSIIKDANEPIEYNMANKFNLITIARIAPEKRFDRILKLAEELEKRNINYQWLILGKVNKLNCTEYEQSMQTKFAKHPNIIFIGEQENPFKYLKKSHYSVLLSDRETWGLVITESKVVGTPCVVTNFDVAYEQIEDGKNGIILNMENENYQQLVDRMFNEYTNIKNNLINYNYDINNLLGKWFSIL